ncbi:MAG TPA: chemotaxis protein CheA, partial [Rhodocyclaceae bacterium]|nr:chemotaxis protein CheA [Rhodocyclaceae bacterium]
MSDFGGMDDLLQDFLIEAGDLLSDVDNKLVELERAPDDRKLLNDIFRGFHTIKGGAGFLNATELVTLCHLTENLFDKLRTGELLVTPECLDAILSATASVRDMFGAMERGMQPTAADPNLIAQLSLAIEGKLEAGSGGVSDMASLPAEKPTAPSLMVVPATANTSGDDLDWASLYGAITGIMPIELHADGARNEPDHGVTLADVPSEQIIQAAIGRRTADKPGYQGNGGGRRAEERTRDNSIRVDTARLDQVLNLSGEIGLTKNRLNALRADILGGKNDPDTLHAIDLAVSQLDLLVSDLQNAVMKTRMQPIGRLFQKYPRIARDLARSLGKDVELMLEGEDTEIDKTMIEDLADPIIHLIRNAVDHGVESMDERLSAGKPEKSIVKLIARQEGDHILLIVSDDGRGMNAEKLRSKALEKGLISDEEANTMDERQSFNLIFLPGFSTVNQISDISGRGVGMDVVRTNIQKLNGTIDIKSVLGSGTTFIISLPLTLA